MSVSSAQATKALDDADDDREGGDQQQHGASAVKSASSSAMSRESGLFSRCMESHIIDDTNLTTARPTTERRGRRCRPAAHRCSTPDQRHARGARRVPAHRAGVAGGRSASRSARLGSAQLFALQQIAEHPDASVNDIAALTFTHQSSVSVVIQRLVDSSSSRRPRSPTIAVASG